ncbi:MAG: hypothetical protein ACKO14_09885 [Armatimonadota bacterium]
MTTLVLMTTLLSGMLMTAVNPISNKVTNTQQQAPAVQKPTLNFVLSKLPRSVGANIYADTSTGNAKVDVGGLDLTTTATEDVLDALVKKLPKGTVWVRVNVPKADSKRLTGDNLAAFVFAQSNLIGKVGEIRKGYTEILGQQIPDEQAHELVKTLNLSTYYVIFRPGYVDRTEELTGEEREALIERLIARPDLRAKYVAEHGKVMGEVIKKLLKDKQLLPPQ